MGSYSNAPNQPEANRENELKAGFRAGSYRSGDMEFDRESESQVSEPHCPSWWMMKNLWQREVTRGRHLQISLADTCLLEEGHLVCWYFTSPKNGYILKVLEVSSVWSTGWPRDPSKVTARFSPSVSPYLAHVLVVQADERSLHQHHRLSSVTPDT